MPETTPLERAIADILWPNGDRDHEWSPDTLEEISQAFMNLRPDLTPYNNDPVPLFLLGDIKPCQ